jgi:hypothetical protein
MNEDVILPKGYVPELEPEPVEDEFASPVEAPVPASAPLPVASFRGLADADDDEREEGLARISEMNADMVDPSDVYGAEQWETMLVSDPTGGAGAMARFGEEWTLGMTPSSRAAAIAKTSFDEGMGSLVGEFAERAGASLDVGDPLEFARKVSAARFARRRVYG